MSKRVDQGLKELAGESLEAFRLISATAIKKLRIPTPSAEGTIFNQTATDGHKAAENLAAINRSERKGNQVLVDEPTIARVDVRLDDGQDHTYYIARHSAPAGLPFTMASRNAPVGRIASMDPGDEFELPNGDVIEILRKLIYHPLKKEDMWDSRRTFVSREEGPITVDSLRQLLGVVRNDPDAASSGTNLPAESSQERQAESRSYLNELLEQEAEGYIVTDGVKRDVLEQMGLRDQAILDKYQDEIFRLPIDSRLMLLGPPGTGKTTTLIRRLGQKLDRDMVSVLNEDERDLVLSIQESTGLQHADSWMLFTPTELLRQYVKEAFARENVAASDDKIRTWDDYRRVLARSTFRLLKTPQNSSGFVMKTDLDILRSDCLSRSTTWFNDFNKYLTSRFFDNHFNYAQKLKSSNDVPVAEIGEKFLEIIDTNRKNDIQQVLLALAAERTVLRKVSDELKAEVEGAIDKQLDQVIGKDREFLQKLFTFTDQLAKESSAVEVESLQGEQEDPVSDIDRPLHNAINTYKGLLRQISRAKYSETTIRKDSRAAKILDFIGEDALPDSVALKRIGESLDLRTAVERFNAPVRKYFDSIAGSYRGFRIDSKKNEKWYKNKEIKNSEIDPLETDLVLLTMLRTSRTFIIRRNYAEFIDSTSVEYLKGVEKLFRAQILVDEVTDFSPLQIGCMSELSHPQGRSFFACGDFNQRLTAWGSTSEKDVLWATGTIEKREVSIGYRQSARLNELAKQIAEGGEELYRPAVAPEIEHGDIAPVLALNIDSTAELAEWLGERIVEIEGFLGTLPSIAVFTCSEEEVEPLASALGVVLEDQNIEVQACPQGRVVGRESVVRVFDIQHIKGLEFEAVFFVNIDTLEKLQKNLFRKYLYVGATRAATYLGMSCQGSLPSALDNVRGHFVDSWHSNA